MSTLAFLVAAAVVAPPSVTVHGGQRVWFLPGRLAIGSSVVCVTHGHRLTMKVTASASDTIWAWAGGGSVRGSVTLRPNGAAEVDCGVDAGRPRIPVAARYLVTRNGLGLLRGPNTRARLERLYGPARRAGCALSWPSIGLRASFASCDADAVLVRATVRGARWSSLDGVHVGDPVARMLYQDIGAKRMARTAWVLGGVGLRRPPRLIATIGPAGTVTGFTIVPVDGARPQE